jgi:hypothetical protein
VGKRLIRWFVINILFALIPFFASLTIHWLGDKLGESGWSMAPELVFFSLMVSVTAFTDVLDISEAIGWDVFLTLMGFALLAGALWSAVMYGIYLYSHVLSVPSSVFQARFFFFASVVAGVLFALSLLVEIVISKVKAVYEAP